MGALFALLGGVAELGVGSILADRYRLDAVLGQGGMGSVWRAHHLTLNSPVAIKLIDPSIAMNEAALERFMREAQAAATLRSPHVVQTFDYGVHEGVPYIAMELMEGESLADRLERVKKLSPTETSKVLTHVARAVGKAHDTGIVHRDLKPDNIFIVHNDDEEVAKVLDFGIAKLTGGAMGPGSQTRTGAVMGTPYYMSPEQAEGVRAVDHRTDIWAIGVIAYECLLGVRPFDGQAIGELVLRICTKPIPVPSENGMVPRGFDEWFARACNRDLAARFGSVREMIEALRVFSTDAGFDGAERASGADLGTAAAPIFAQTTHGAVSGAATIPVKSGGLTLALAGGALAIVAGSLGVYLFAGESAVTTDPAMSADSVEVLPAAAPEEAGLVPSAASVAPPAEPVAEPEPEPKPSAAASAPPKPKAVPVAAKAPVKKAAVPPVARPPAHKPSQATTSKTAKPRGNEKTDFGF